MEVLDDFGAVIHKYWYAEVPWHVPSLRNLAAILEACLLLGQRFGYLLTGNRSNLHG